MAAASPISVGARVVAYARVSTDEQLEHGYSLDEQGRRMKAWAEERSLIVDTLYSESFTGSRAVRPRLSELLTHAKRERIGWLLVTAYDRLERIGDDRERAWLLYQIEEAGLQLVDISSSSIVSIGSAGDPNSRLHHGLISLVARWERETIAVRTTRGREARAREDGLYWGGRRPFGFRFAPGLRRGKPTPNGRLVPDPDEAPVVRVMYQLFLDGMNLSAMSRYLNREVPMIVPTGSALRAAGRWTSHAIRQILGNPVNCGMLILNKTKGEEPKIRQSPYPRVLKSSRRVRPREEWIEVPGAVDPIIARATWEKAQDLLRQRVALRSRAVQPYMLRGLLHHTCGRVMTGHQRQKRDGSEIRSLTRLPHLSGHVQRRYHALDYDAARFYACQDCNVLVSAWKTENALWYWLGAQLHDPDFMDRLQAAAREHQHVALSRTEALSRQLDTLIKQRAKLMSLIEDREVLLEDPFAPAKQLTAGLVALRADVERLDEQLRTMRGEIIGLDEPGPLDLASQQRSAIWELFADWQRDYSSPKLTNVLLRYFFAKVEYGHRTEKRNSGFLRVHGTARLASGIHEMHVPYTAQELVDQIELESSTRWRFVGFLSTTARTRTSHEGEERDWQMMTDLLGPPPSYSSYFNLSAPDGLTHYAARWLTIDSMLRP